MLAYAPDRSRLVQRTSAPHAMLFIVAAHVAAVAAVMSAKIAIDRQPKDPPIVIKPIPIPEDPPPQPVDQPRPAPNKSRIDTVPPIVPAPQPSPLPIDSQPVPDPLPGPVIGPSIQPQPLPIPRPVADPVRAGPRFITPAHDLRPPYPASKIAREEEASLRLRLSIDVRGRVTAVEPVGSADPAFLEAARRHLIAKWRYKPATEDGRPVASSTVITLRFELEG